MAVPSRIVSFNEAQQNTRAIHARQRSRAQHVPITDRHRDSQNLNNIFQLDFSDNAEEDTFAVSSGPRSAIFSEEDLLEEEGAAPKPRGVAGVFSRIADARKSSAKRNAERAFDKAYGGSDAAAAGGAGGPRAALYTGKMGASQKKANRIQAQGGSKAGLGGFSLPSINLPQVFHTFKRNTAAVACALAAVMLVGSIYTPAQQYYQQIRERDRLSAEYEAVQERNAELQSTVDWLGTDEGLEDRAHAEFGFINQDEKTASVIGIEVDNTPEFHANVTPGSIPAPETWYSGFLDALFLYDRG